MRLEQRIGRIHRLGQTRTCTIYNLATKNTIEEHIVQLLHEKIRMFESVIGELDFIVSEQKFANFERDLFEAAMTSSSDHDLAAKIEQVGQTFTDI